MTAGRLAVVRFLIAFMSIFASMILDLGFDYFLIEYKLWRSFVNTVWFSIPLALVWLVIFFAIKHCCVFLENKFSKIVFSYIATEYIVLSLLIFRGLHNSYYGAEQVGSEFFLGGAKRS